MGFNKRYINEESIRNKLKEEGGLYSIISFIKNPDALIMEDGFSEKFCEIILNNDEKFILDKIVKIL